MIYGIVYHLVHILIDLFITLKTVLRYICIRLRSLFYFFLNQFMVSAPQFSQWHVKPLHFKKLPSHIGFVIIEDYISFSDLSNLILWCLPLGIRHISLYDTKGTVKENGNLLYEQTVLKKQEYQQKDDKKYKLLFHNIKHQSMLEEQVCNGHRIDENIHVHLLSREDGRSRIVNAARNACLDVKKECRKSISITDTVFDSYIRDSIKLSDPDLILQFGSVCSLMGYLPWHVRLSEILSLPSHHSIQLSEFIGVLNRYNQCEQRFGK